jgi:CubicO group peptidase (beta-lactamase class C family)
MRKPATAEDILDQWAKKPLDFDPGTRWQYSNTNYVAAGKIVEKVSGMPYFDFLSKRILKPLKMNSAMNLDDRDLGPSDATGYTRFVLGPPRVASKEAKGWVYAAGELAMTAHDLALWDISLMDHQLLSPASFDAMTTPVRLRNGTPTNYGLGVGINNVNGHPRVAHGGAVSGFVSYNAVFPDQATALVVFANQDGADAYPVIDRISSLLLNEAEDPGADQALKQARQIFDGLVEGKLDRTLLSANADAYFTQQVLEDTSSSLKPLAAPEAFRQTSVEQRGGMTYRHFQIRFKGKTLRLDTLMLPNGKLEQYLIQ